MTVPRTLAAVAALCLLAAIVLAPYGWRSELAPIAPPDARSFDTAVVQQRRRAGGGRQLHYLSYG